MPPEIGHLRYEEDGPTAFGKRGSLEAFAAASALGPIAAWKFPQRWPAGVPASEQIVQLARAGDADAGEVLRINAQAVAYACTILAEVFGVEMIVLGSSARYFGPSGSQVQELFYGRAPGALASRTAVSFRRPWARPCKTSRRWRRRCWSAIETVKELIMRLRALPVFLVFLAMGFGDAVGPFVSLAKGQFHLSNAVANLIPWWDC